MSLSISLPPSQTLDKLRSYVVNLTLTTDKNVIDTLFSTIDINHDNQINVDEFNTYFTKWDPTITSSELTELFTIIDIDGSKTIDLREFKSLLKTTLPLERFLALKRLYTYTSSTKSPINNITLPVEDINNFKHGVTFHPPQSFGDFTRLCEILSPSIIDDNFFMYIVGSTWNIDYKTILGLFHPYDKVDVDTMTMDELRNEIKDLRNRLNKVNSKLFT